MAIQDFNFVKIMDRVSTIMERRLNVAPYDKNIARELGLTSTQYANNKARNKIPYAEIAMFCDKNQITINWVLFGRSGMSLIDREENVFKIRYIEKVNASCGGGGSDNENVKERYLSIDMMHAKKLGIIANKNIEALKVMGDSMIPTIQEDSIILLDRSNNELQENEVFVVNSNEGLFVKRLKTIDDVFISLVSDNDVFASITMQKSEISIIGKVIGTLQKDSLIDAELINFDRFISLECEVSEIKHDLKGLIVYLQSKGLSLKRASELNLNT